MSSSLQGILQLRAPAQPAAPEPAKPTEPSTQSSDKRRPPAAVVRRRRLAAILALALAGIVALIISLLVGSGPAPPATGAAAVVPADALAYVNLSIDPSRGAVEQAGSLAARFPGYRPLLSDVETRVGGILSGGAPLDFARDVAPWLGNEAALAVLNTTTSTAGSLIVLDVSDRARARAFLARSGARPVGSYRRVQLLGYPTGTELAFLGRYLAFGQDASLRAAIDVQTGIAPSLQHDPTYQRAAAGEPAGRVLDAYASASGVQRLLMPQHGVIGAVGALLDQPALGAAALSLSPADGGARLKVHTVLDPQLAQLHPSTVTTFTPSIPDVIPAGSTVMLDTSSLDSLAPRLLRAGAAGGVIGQVGPLLKRLGRRPRRRGGQRRADPRPVPRGDGGRGLAGGQRGGCTGRDDHHAHRQPARRQRGARRARGSPGPALRARRRGRASRRCSTIVKSPGSPRISSRWARGCRSITPCSAGLSSYRRA